jgi:hypothetical protein
VLTKRITRDDLLDPFTRDGRFIQDGESCPIVLEALALRGAPYGNQVFLATQSV